MTLALSQILSPPTFMSHPLAHIQKDNKSNQVSSYKAYKVLTLGVPGL